MFGEAMVVSLKLARFARLSLLINKKCTRDDVFNICSVLEGFPCKYI